MRTHTKANVLKTKPILNYSKICLIFAGIWPLPLPTQNRVLQRAYFIYSCLVKVYFPTFLISLSIELAVSIFDEGSNTDIQQIFSKLHYIIMLLITFFAMILCQREEVKKIITYIIQDDKYVVCSKDLVIMRSHFTQVRMCSRSCLTIMILTFGSGISMCLENYWRRLEIDHDKKHRNGSVEKPFVFALYYYKLDTFKHETSLLVANALFVVMNSLLFASTKMLLFSSIIHSASILKRLQLQFQKLYACSDRVVVTLRDLVQQHQNAIEFVAKLNNWLKYLIFWDFLLNSLNIATISIQLMTFEKNMLTSPILFFCVLFTQTFILGWSANEVKCQSLVLADALYCSPWYDQSENVKSTLLTMLLRAQRPLVLTIGPLDAMTIESALTVI
ncbi:odorant receptor 45b-like isoform X2 [Cylas formicarius]|uniref:odorant receptor 45b-like isoform X2 n=1 Tax=Cylas formicarius TaxID=197179 RepID=UPI002958CF6C|nr:odorant receptor 45b-like isoform X2 [Cylas formicarius]